ncbi:Cobyrinic acid A,C-diamide synthase [Gossypium australe]|uniref:Cobyrinic acid A,C-diamide synthase n=1 Tax=Gossypium australe TaxID=47621 RepID=A0A5B6W5L4_9ROSI|nr:Cobyrinic acid A,C-diamide synthase [Gossypium australe]
MASGFLLTAAPFLPSQRNEMNGLLGHMRSSFHGKVGYKQSFLRRESNSPHGGRLLVASVLGRKVQKKETVVPDPDYRIPFVLLGLAGGLVYTDNLLSAAPVGLLGLLLLFQTTRVRFVFDDEALEVKVGEQLEESGENVFVGGKNRWKYSTFVNWELWWPSFPILVYFKETQTKPEGQVHFFPVIFNGKQLYDVMVERAGPSKTSGPK